MSEAQSIIDHVVNSSPIHTLIPGRNLAIISDQYNVHGLEMHMPTPYRERGTIIAEFLDSFATAFCRWAEPTAIILASPNTKRLVAHFRHHDAKVEDSPAQTARWIDHKAILALTDSEEWKAWQSINEKPLNQKQFFQFLEDHLEDVISPEPAALLEIAETIRGSRRVNFQNTQRMANGDVSIIWDETTEAKAGEKGQGTVPAKITIRVPIYEQAPDLMFDITCSFRWRVENSGLQISISIRHLATVQRMAMTALLDKLADTIKDIGGTDNTPPILIGDWKD